MMISIFILEKNKQINNLFHLWAWLISYGTAHLKYIRFLFCILMFLLPLTTMAQTYTTERLLQTFKTSDVYQTIEFGKVYKDLASRFSEKAFAQQVEGVQKYLRNHDDDRVRIRMFMYERLAHEKIPRPDTHNTEARYLNIMELAIKLGDEQLLSEVYCKYAMLCGPSKKLYYLLKCIEIRERIGIKYFTDISANYYWASNVLYNITNYKSCNVYALKGLRQYTEKDKKDFLHLYILAADLVAASYLQTNKADSAIYYYKEINGLVNDCLARPGRYKLSMSYQMLQIWQGVVSGGIARAYMLQKKYDQAYGLLLQNLKTSNDFKQWEDVAGVQNSLATIDRLRNKMPLAISRYLDAYQLALKTNKLPLLVTATQGLAACFAINHKYDSAYFYQQKYIHWKNLLDDEINKGRLDIVKAQVDFEKTKKTLLFTENNLIKQKFLRNAILIAIVLLMVISLLLYNRKRLRMSLQTEKLEREKQQSESEKNYAYQQIDFFVQNIADKNDLIKQLELQLTENNDSGTITALRQLAILTEEDWEKFKLSFETVNPNYLYRLRQKMPHITQAEQRIIVLAKLGLSTKEMANTTGVSPETIRSVISRMRKKFNVSIDIHTLANEV